MDLVIDFQCTRTWHTQKEESLKNLQIGMCQEIMNHTALVQNSPDYLIIINIADQALFESRRGYLAIFVITHYTSQPSPRLLKNLLEVKFP